MSGVQNFRLLYDRHTGPYTLLLCCTKPDGKGGQTHYNRADSFRLDARSVHDRAVDLITKPGDIVSAMAFSESEQQFIGAWYQRGRDPLPTWIDDVPEPVEEPSIFELAGRFASELTFSAFVSVQTHDADPGEPATEVPEVPATDYAQASAPQPRPAVAPRARSTRGGLLELDPGNAERWPATDGPQKIRAWFEAEDGRKASVRDIVDALGAELQAIGVGFPASMVSRLKQQGFLREAE